VIINLIFQEDLATLLRRYDYQSQKAGYTTAIIALSYGILKQRTKYFQVKKGPSLDRLMPLKAHLHWKM
jgi:hypothetical protein